LNISDVPKAEPEAASNDATTNPPIHFREIPEERQQVNQPQGRQILEQTSPTKAWTLFVVAWIAAVAAGLVVWAALANPA